MLARCTSEMIIPSRILNKVIHSLLIPTDGRNHNESSYVKAGENRFRSGAANNANRLSDDEIDDGGSIYSKQGATVNALLKKRRPAGADSDDDSHGGQESYRKLTKFVNNQAFEQPDDDDEDAMIYKKKGTKGFVNNANRRNSDDSD